MFTVAILIIAFGIGFAVWTMRDKPSDSTGSGGNSRNSDTKEK